MYRAVLDTCVLIPSRQRDFLLQLAAEGAYSPLWGTGILVEINYVLARLDAKAGWCDRADYRTRLLEQMQDAFPGSTIPAPKNGTYHYDIKDPDDGHVAHAAVLGKADAIVTEDRRAGFTTSSDLAAANIEVLSPPDFAANTVAAHPRAAVRALRAISARLHDPAMTPVEVLDDLAARYTMHETANLLRSAFEMD